MSCLPNASCQAALGPPGPPPLKMLMPWAALSTNLSNRRPPPRSKPTIARITTSCQCISVPQQPISTQFAAEMSRLCIGCFRRFPARSKPFPTTEQILPSLIQAQRAVKKPVQRRGNTKQAKSRRSQQGTSAVAARERASGFNGRRWPRQRRLRPKQTRSVFAAPRLLCLLKLLPAGVFFPLALTAPEGVSAPHDNAKKNRGRPMVVDKPKCERYAQRYQKIGTDLQQRL